MNVALRKSSNVIEVIEGKADWEADHPKRIQEIIKSLEERFNEFLLDIQLRQRSNLLKLSEKELQVEHTQIKSWKVTLNDELIVELPYQFEALYNSIEESKYILELEENWDDEGSPPYKESTWRRAIKFITDYTVLIYSETHKIIDAPIILHGPDGSIDLLWKKEKYRLLINIPEAEELNAPVSFYGDDFKSMKIEGTFEPFNYNQGLGLSLLWLK